MAVRTTEWGSVTRDSGFRSRQDGTLKWWIMLALILSFGFHAVLIFVFENFDLGNSAPVVQDRRVPERLKIDPKLLQQQEAIRDIPKDLAPVAKPDVEMFKPNLDEFDKASMIPKNQEIDLTPSVKDIQNLV
ncbi:MAG: outer membrane protein OmpA, partial [Verrucomicrobiaceae bacterium]|nr:outer membrane protein OmpA [Verrucomicrobiaceae bacterium]